MAHSTYVIFAGTANWRLGVISPSGRKLIDVAVPGNASADQIAALVSESLHKAGHLGEAVVLAVPSAWCFAASIEVGDLPRQDRKAMLYRLEEKLPLTAESVVADFITRPGGAALGVCARVDTLGLLVDALEARRVPVQIIAPTALLGAQAVAGNEASSRVLLLREDSDQINLLAMKSGSPVSWSLVPADASDIERQLGLLSMSFPQSPEVELLEIEPALFGALRQSLKCHPGTVASAAMTTAAQVLSGQQRPWIDLRRGALAIRDRLRLSRKPLNAAIGACIALLLCLSAALLVRAQRYAQLEQSSRQEMSEAFREQFPGWDVPENVRVIVESEHRKAQLAATGARPAQSSRSALRSFVDVMTRLPKEGGYFVDRMSFAESSFELHGLTKSYEQLDELTAAARKGGMDVPPPEAHKNADGSWGFTLRGTIDTKQGDQVAKGGT